jgi:adenine C2-methylase RlmN of 23S rRNA A2503 and tRNA A37
MVVKTRAEKISEILDDLGCPKYRLTQVYDAIYKKGIKEYTEISTLPLVIRNRLRAEMGEVLYQPQNKFPKTIGYDKIVL